MRKIAIPNLMIYITGAMLAVYILEFVGVNIAQFLIFDRDLILQGQVWRVISYVIMPPSGSNVIFTILALYFYYFIGSSLENHWGSSRFCLYYLFGILGTIIAGFITGYGINTYLNLSLFFAFAALYPNTQVMLFFIIPIKIKYLAYLDALLFVISFIFGSWITRAAILASLLNFFIFFGPDFIRTIKEQRSYSATRRNFRKQMNDNQNRW